MLISFDEVKKILVCPIIGLPLVQKGETFVPVENETEKSTKIHYRFVNGQPVLVDFENSLLDKNEIFMRGGNSVLERKKSKLREWIKESLLHPEANKIAANMAVEFSKKLKKKNNKRPKLLIIGAGTKGNGTAGFYNDTNIDVIGFDIYTSPLTNFIADAHSIPIETESVDGVWIQYVLEHVVDPWKVVGEIVRVLKKDGIVYSETPFLQQVHEGAYDFVRFTHSGHRWLFRDFVEISSGIAMGSGVHLLWSLEHNIRGIFRSRKIGQITKIFFFWLRLLEKIIPERFVIDNASSFFFFGAKADKPLRPKDMVKYYKGGL